jgi:hypothetical protein
MTSLNCMQLDKRDSVQSPQHIIVSLLLFLGEFPKLFKRELMGIFFFFTSAGGKRERFLRELLLGIFT